MEKFAIIYMLLINFLNSERGLSLSVITEIKDRGIISVDIADRCITIYEEIQKCYHVQIPKKEFEYLFLAGHFELIKNTIYPTSLDSEKLLKRKNGLEIVGEYKYCPTLNPYGCMKDFYDNEEN